MSDQYTTVQMPIDHTDHTLGATVHDAAVRMQAQFLQTGAFQGQDVAQVLGDPRDVISSTVPTAYALPTRRSANLTVSLDTCVSMTVR